MQAHRMITRDKSYNVATLLRLTYVFSIVMRLSRHSTNDFPLKLNLDCCNIMLIVVKLSSELVSSMFVMIMSS